MSVETITLSNPIEINGNPYSELTYDLDEITIAQFAQAEGKSKSTTKNFLTLAEFDYTLQFYLGAYAVIAINPEIDITDIERIHGRDVMSIAEAGRFFTTPSDGSGQSNSEEPSETTPGSTQPQSKTSMKCDSQASLSTTEKQ